MLVVPRAGDAWVAGESAAPGECALAGSIGEIEFATAGSCLITQPIMSKMDGMPLDSERSL